MGGVTLTEVPSGTLLSAGSAALGSLRRGRLWRLDARNLGQSGRPWRPHNAQLLDWQLNFGLAPSNPPPVITLSHGILYTNSLPAYGVQYFIVPVPQWATLATNILAIRRPGPHHQSAAASPSSSTRPTIPRPRIWRSSVRWRPSGTDCAGHQHGPPPLVIGQTYYLALTNPNPVGGHLWARGLV